MLMRYLAVIISFIVSVSCAYEKYTEADEKVNAENRILSSFATQIAGAESISVKSILPDDIETKVFNLEEKEVESTVIGEIVMDEIKKEKDKVQEK